MKADIQELKKEGILNLVFEDSPQDLDLVEPVKAEITLKCEGAGFISAKGHISAKINSVCDVCLEDFVYNLEADIDEIYAENTLHDIAKGEIEIKDGVFAIDLNGEQEIDLTDLIYQSVIISLPNKLVCGINCNGSEKLQEYLVQEYPRNSINI